MTRDRTQLPPVAHGAASPTTVLVQDAPDDPGLHLAALAVSGTARGAGAVVVPVRGSDPRADPAAGRALRAAPSAVVAVGDAFGPAGRLAERLDVARSGNELPGGGQRVLPGRRLVALYGTPGTPSLGALGEQGLDAAVVRVKELADRYRDLGDGLPVTPTFEVIATVASGAPGRDGDYSNERDWVSCAPGSRARPARGSTSSWTCSAGGPTSSPRPRPTAPCSSCPASGWPSTRSGG